MASPADETDSLFADETPRPAAGLSERPAAHQPLAARMRPRRLEEIVGQRHILNPGSLLPQLIATAPDGVIEP